MDLENWDPIKMAESSETFCVFPWMHQYVHPNGEVKGCCVYKGQYGNLKNNTLKEIFNNQTTKQVRLDMLQGKPVKNCNFCNRDRELKIDAFNQQMNRRYFSADNTSVSTRDIREIVASTKPDGSVDTHKLYYIDARFNNLCNFTCRTCFHEYSTGWVATINKIKNVVDEVNENGKYQNNFDIPDSYFGAKYTFAGKTEEDTINQILPHLPYVESIYFAGGEPMMQIEHYLILEELVKLGRSDCKIRYNTNYSRLNLQGKDAINLWKNFNQVEIDASLDASYEKAELWREGTVWSDVVDNANRVKKEAPHVKLGITCSVGWPNVYSAIDLHKEWTELQYISSIDNFTVNYVYGPEEYSLNNIPFWKKQQVTKKILEHIEWIKTHTSNGRAIGTWENCLTIMNQHSEQKEAFLNQVNYKNLLNNRIFLMDKVHKKDFWATFPEHKDLQHFFNAGQ